MRLVNVPMRAILRLPLRTPLSGRLMLVTHIGRRTGRVYRQPVSYVVAGSALLTPGGGRWTANLRDGEPVPLRLRGRDVHARPELVRDVDEVDRLFQVMAQVNPRLRRFVPIPQGADGHLDRQALITALAHGFRIVRWHLDAPSAAE
jgi:deazaflavin-dependent oxidoreductase (nitroreductase family)